MSKDIVDKVLNAVQKKYGKESATTFDPKDSVQIERIPSGSLSVDLAIGGGYPKGRITEVYGPESSGKAQPLSSKVLTPDGWVLMKDVKIGQLVCTPDGSTSPIIGIYPQGMQDVYEVTLDDKSKARCTLDHLWSVQTRDSDLEHIYTTKQLIESGLGTYFRKFQIATTNPVHFHSKDDLEIDPYLLGLLLGDGSLRDSVVLSSKDQEIIDGNKKNDIVVKLSQLNLYKKKSEDKFIPTKYLHASVEDRVSLFQGLIDSDGYIHPNEKSIQFVTVSKSLAEDFIELSRSLGMRCVVSDRVNSYTSSTGNKVSGKRAYYVNCLHNTYKFQPARLKRKQLKFSDVSSHCNRFIESIDPVGREECQCIMIAHPDSLYITDNYIVTHNTTLAIHAGVECQKQGGVVGYVDMENAFDPFYAKQVGLDVENQFVFSQPDSGEQALDILDTMIRNGVNMVILDSVAAMVPQAELDGDYGESKMGLQARLMSQGMRKLVGAIKKNDVIAIFINQIRMKIGVMFGNPETTTGGNALKFYSSIRLDIRRIGQEKEGEEVIANKTRVKVVKNKTYPPFKQAEFFIEFGIGIDRLGELLDKAVDLDIVNKKGSWFAYDGTNIGQGRSKTLEMLKDNEELVDSIEQQVLDKIHI